jgi:hypothetical protein
MIVSSASCQAALPPATTTFSLHKRFSHELEELDPVVRGATIDQIDKLRRWRVDAKKIVTADRYYLGTAASHLFQVVRVHDCHVLRAEFLRKACLYDPQPEV